MRKVTASLILLSLFIAPFIARAQEDMGEPRCSPMCQSLMMRRMMGKSIVATNDGGVVVLAGNQLFKYDKDLNLVKTVELKIEPAAMQKRIPEMGQKYPMMKQKMKNMMKTGTGAATSEDKTAAETEQAPAP